MEVSYMPLLIGILLLMLCAGCTAGWFVYRTRVRRFTGRLNEILAVYNSSRDETGSLQLPDTGAIPAEFAGLTGQLNSLLSRKTGIEEIPLTQAQKEVRTEGLRKVIDNLYLVNELGQRVTSSLNLHQTFQHLYSTINSMMDASVLELAVYDTPESGTRLFSNTPSENTLYRNHIAEWSRKNNREVYLSDAERDYARYVFEPLAMPDGRMAASVMVFPVVHGSTVTGTLSVISFKQNSFEPYHQEIIRSLLGYISVAIENALTHDELNRTKIRAEQSEKFKEQFLANMSHEIRTPINAVTGMTRLLLEKQPRADQLRYLESIRNASDSLLVIINDILDLSKIEAGKVELERIDFSVDDVLHNVRDIMQFKAEEKGLSLALNTDPSLPPILIGDPTRLSQVLINLVGNAIKFTEKGGVTISVIPGNTIPEPEGNQRISLHFAITDTGIGMTGEQQSKLFMDYAQASSDTTRKYGGTGLGLSISKQLVQLQGGTISVKSEPGKGSTFSFSLPYQVSKSKTPATRQQHISDEMLKAMKGFRVLLADDNEYNRIVARETLQLKLDDVVVDEASDGKEAVELLKKNRYDVVLMDLVMPGMDGLEATRHIRQQLPKPLCAIPVLALTASVIKSEIDKCMEAGMNGFVPKPFKPHELLGAIYRVIHGTEASAQPLQVPEAPMVVSKQMLVDLDYLRDFTEGDPVRLQRLIDLFLKKVPDSINAVRQAMDKGDFEKVRVAVHSMKPQLRFTGVLQGLELAETIESMCMEKSSLDQLPGMVSQLTLVCNQAIAELSRRES